MNFGIWILDFNKNAATPQHLNFNKNAAIPQHFPTVPATAETCFTLRKEILFYLFY